MKRPQLSLRMMMVAIAIIALPLGFIVVRSGRLSRRASASAELNLQQQVTSGTLTAIQSELHREAGGLISASVSAGASGGPDEESWTTEMEASSGSGPDQHPLVHLEVEGGWDGTRVRAIVITDLGAPRNAWAIKRLTAAYAAKRWPYRVVRPKPEPLEPR